MTSQKEFKYENFISALISFMIILALISAAAFPVILDFIYVGVETVNIHDEALTKGLPIMDNGSYTQPLTLFALQNLMIWKRMNNPDIIGI